MSGDTGALSTAVIVSVASAFPDRSYSQEEIGALLGLENRVVKKLLRSPHIQRRHLYLPEPDPRTGRARAESPADLHAKFRDGALDIGARAIHDALEAASLSPADVDYLLCVTSTGFLVPGLSSLLSRELGFNRSLHRADVVGMGCNAGLNGMNPLVQWVRSHPGRVAMLVCCEVNSAIYVVDETPRTGIVNSLFGDGAAAVAVCADPAGTRPGGDLVKFESYLIHEALSAMRYDWDDAHGKFSFYIDRDVPYVVGANAENVVDALLDGTGVRRSEIAHWIVHSGGKKVIDSVKVNLGLTTHDLRYTSGVLRDYGNLSSGSFLFSLKRLLDEGRRLDGEHSVLMTMGPGSTIETALVRWSDERIER